MSALDTHPTPASTAALSEGAMRARIERDLHDGAQTLLVAMRIKLGLAADRAGELGAADLHALLVELGDEAQDALERVRSVAHGTYPPLLATRGLAEALAAEADRMALPVRVRGRVPRTDHEREAAVYYCCLEALQNAAKHAGPAARATVRLEWAMGMLRFEVRDDGTGFQPPARSRSGGLAHMRERVAEAGGELTVAACLGHGTCVRGRVPWPATRTPTTKGTAWHR
jgi:signal transduction histidine kinase